MRQKVRDIVFLILGISLTILFFTVVIPVLAIIGLIKGNYSDYDTQK